MMLGLIERLGRRALFCLDPETAHGISISALKSGLPVALSPRLDPRLKLTAAGITFDNPLGMAAGYDKNAEAPDALLRLGFGFVEVGTVTPLPQGGNPRPRIFRLALDGAVINRLGFNNEGHDPAVRRLVARAHRAGTIGVNIGANKDSTDRIGDYEAGVTRFARHAAYLTINISSPNTPGLRAMQDKAQLADLLSRVTQARNSAVRGLSNRVPLFLKIAPDLHESNLEDIAKEVAANSIEGVIVSNTTVSRPSLRSTSHANESGGLSGKPLFERSTVALAKMRKLLGSDVAIIGVGGIDSTGAALEKIRAGADLVQLYTAMIYAGPTLPGRIVTEMSAFLDAEKLRSITEIRDTRLEYWASKPL